MPASKAQMKLKEEDELISMFSSDVKSTTSFQPAIKGLIAASTPLFVFIRVQQVDVSSAWHLMIAFTLAAAYVLQFTYQKGKFNLKTKIANEIHDGVSKEVNDSMTASEKKGLNANQKNDKILRRQNDIAEQSAMEQAVFLTNCAYCGGGVLENKFRDKTMIWCLSEKFP